MTYVYKKRQTLSTLAYTQASIHQVFDSVSGTPAQPNSQLHSQFLRNQPG